MASQYQANMHSQATTSPLGDVRKGAIAWRKVSGLAVSLPSCVRYFLYSSPLEADTKAGKLDSAVAIRDEIKNLEDAAESATVTQVRRRLEGSVWQWTSDQVLQLNRDGTVTASWTKRAGRWYVNPDSTVAWWVDSFPNVHIMRFNKALTEHKSFVPTRPEFDRAGKRLK